MAPSTTATIKPVSDQMSVLPSTELASFMSSERARDGPSRGRHGRVKFRGTVEDGSHYQEPFLRAFLKNETPRRVPCGIAPVAHNPGGDRMMPKGKQLD